MSCYSPLKAYIGREAKPNGKKSIVFSLREAFHTPSGKNFPVDLPCGQCIGCRLERSRQWAVRCIHEASLYENNCFITLTFDESSLNEKRSLVKADFQKFMKRLRKRFSCDRIRYFHCGEYGEKLGRPHHHACLFNFDFPDKEMWSIRCGVPLFVSVTLKKLWPFGHSTIGDVTFESAAYVSRYIVKKITGDMAKNHYNGRTPEYVTMSRRPGIGREWINSFMNDVYPHDFVVVRGNLKCRPPKYYDSIYDLHNPLEYGKLKLKREEDARCNPDNSYDRLKVRKRYTEANLKRKVRCYETEGV